jgi:hypothetical protein
MFLPHCCGRIKVPVPELGGGEVIRTYSKKTQTNLHLKGKTKYFDTSVDNLVL